MLIEFGHKGTTNSSNNSIVAGIFLMFVNVNDANDVRQEGRQGLKGRQGLFLTVCL